MKKFIGLLLVGVMLLSSGGCAKKTADLTAGTETAVRQAVIATDKYLDQELSVEEAHDKITAVSKDLKEADDIYSDEWKAQLDLLSLSVAFLGFVREEPNGEEIAELVEKRNKLASYVGVKER